MQLIILIAH